MRPSSAEISRQPQLIIRPLDASVSVLPARLPSPFAEQPHAVAEDAANELIEELAAGRIVGDHDFFAPGGGKMFGVLVVRSPDDKVGYLTAFSGMVGNRWFVPGFAPPLFSTAERDQTWRADQRAVDELTDQIERLRLKPQALEERKKLDHLLAAQRRELLVLTEDQKTRRARRRQLRQRGCSADELNQLAAESRHDKAVRRTTIDRHESERKALEASVAKHEEQLHRQTQARRELSQTALTRIQATYRMSNFADEKATVTSLFAPKAAPAGTGDCAGPKLLAWARSAQLQPVALAEFWWGAPPLAGGRRSQAFYPSCRGKCGPLLDFMLRGLEVEEVPRVGASPKAKQDLAIVFEDDWLIAYNKPSGMLSVKGRTSDLQECVERRLRERVGDGARVVHRLDVDTSGLMLACKRACDYPSLQKLFASRSIRKTYVAWLDGTVADDTGVISLALRVDIDDRPRQIYDPQHGKEAITQWHVLERNGRRTKVSFRPLTGRSHQLRVHASHHLGLAAPIVGDRLYGDSGERMLLHAESLEFDHPFTGKRMALRVPAPF